VVWRLLAVKPEAEAGFDGKFGWHVIIEALMIALC
jgi:hypothetical protein